MAESKNGGSSAGKSKEKDSMLDLDFGNDFLTSWKTTSKVGDDGIDLDFGPVSKGKNKAFDFKKGDIDFDLGDFGNMPSFDLDISSPVKKDANSKKKPEEESTTGNNKAKADRFSFGFDFPDLDSFSFKSSPKKHDAKEKKDEPKKNSLGKSETQEYADHPREENDSRDSETTRNPSTQVGDAAAAGSETGNHITNTHDKGQQNSTTVSDKTSAYEELTTFEKTKNIDKQQSDSQLHKVSPEEACIPIEAALEVSAHSTSAAKSSKESMSELQEDDVDSGSVVINQGDKQCFDKNEMVNTSSSSGSPVHSEPSLQHGLSPQNANGGVPNSGDVHTSVGKKDGQKNIHIESLVGLSSASTAMKEFTSGKHGQIKSQSLLDHSAVSKGSGATASNLIPEKEKEALTVRSKYFKAADKSGDQLHNALNQRKLSSLSEKQVVTKQQHHKDERLGNAKEDQNDGVIPDKPLAQLESRVSTEHSDKESQEGSQSLLSSGSMSEDVYKGKLVSRGRESNAKTLDSSRLTVRTVNLLESNAKTLDSSRLTVLTEKSRSENSPNPDTSAPKVASAQTKTSHTSVVDNGASLRTKVQTPNLSYLKISRPTGPNTDRPKPLPQDYIKSSNVNQNKVLVGVKPSKVDQFVGIKKQAPPTSIHSIKRKRVESPDINVISKCPKHSLLSPILRQTEENSTEDMDIEVLGDKNGVGNRKTSTPNSLQSPKLCNSWEANGMELEVPYSMEKDDNVEKAEAITKELDNICNMLRKKHEEAKEVLVRAIVSNNKLLMLNHPMHDEKIRIVQRFAKKLTLKEIDTHT